MESRPASGRRRRLLWIVLAVLVVLAGLLAATGVATLRAQPLEFSPDSACCSPPARTQARNHSPYFGGALRNEGRFTVRVTAIEGPPGTEAHVAPLDSYGQDSAQPFAPFDLEPGALRFVVLLSGSPGCLRREIAAASRFESSPTVHVAYTRLRVERTATFHADEVGQLWFTKTDGTGCAYLDEGENGR